MILPVIITASRGIAAGRAPGVPGCLAGHGRPPAGRPSATACCRISLPGILTSSLLAITRVAGETAPIMFTAAVAAKDDLPWQGLANPFDILSSQVQALPYHIYTLAARIPTSEYTQRAQYGSVLRVPHPRRRRCPSARWCCAPNSAANSNGDRSNKHPRRRQPPAIRIQDVCFAYGAKQALHDVTLDIPAHRITAFIGPSGCGKSTLLRCINRINDRIPGARITAGSIHIHGIDIYRPDIDLQELRRRVGMVFQKYNPFAEIHLRQCRLQPAHRAACTNAANSMTTAETALRAAALWDEVKDRLHTSALGLSGGQQQRLCIARAIANRTGHPADGRTLRRARPARHPQNRGTPHQLKKQFTIVIVTHNMAQATRCSDRTAFMYLGKLIEYGPTLQIFENPAKPPNPSLHHRQFSAR